MQGVIVAIDCGLSPVDSPQGLTPAARLRFGVAPGRLAGCCVALMMLLIGTGVGSAAPKAGIVSTAWQLDLRFHDPQRLMLKLPGDRHETPFWYLLYEVTNNTGRDVAFYPSFRLVSDTLNVVVGGDQISPSVYDAIAGRHRIEFPFLAPPPDVTGLILQGEENARASVAVFREFDREASAFRIYVSGLSGEMVRILNPAFDPSSEESQTNPRGFILRRTLAIAYDLPGDSTTAAKGVPVRRSRKWVMR